TRKRSLRRWLLFVKLIECRTASRDDVSANPTTAPPTTRIRSLRRRNWFLKMIECRTAPTYGVFDFRAAKLCQSERSRGPFELPDSHWSGAQGDNDPDSWSNYRHSSFVNPNFSDS